MIVGISAAEFMTRAVAQQQLAQEGTQTGTGSVGAEGLSLCTSGSGLSSVLS